MPAANQLPVSNRLLLLALSGIPSLDCILNQVNNVFQISFGPLSLLQVLRGYLVLVFFAITGWFLLKEPRAVRRIPAAAVAAFLLIAMASTKELVTAGFLSMPSLGAYGQMAYWVLFWITVSVVCRVPEQAEIILWGLGIGATLTAFSVVAGLFLGGLNYYQDDSVRSSAGWFDTSKYITGVLVCGSITLLYLGRKRKSWLCPLLAAVCCVACVITYARAGAVALGAVLIWLPAWWLVFARRGQRQWLNRFLVLLVLAGTVAPLVVKTDTLLSRWGDLDDSDKAGSGRASFWKIAVDSYVDATPTQQVFGNGFNAMSDMLFLTTGADIKHTHNDMLDVLLVGGLIGGVWLLFLIGSLARRILRTSLFSIEGAAGTAILLAYLTHGLFTGQLWSTDAMTYYTLSLTCLYILGQHPVSEKSLDLDLYKYAKNLPRLKGDQIDAYN
jgi:O-antigen ligase